AEYEDRQRQDAARRAVGDRWGREDRRPLRRFLLLRVSDRADLALPAAGARGGGKALADDTRRCETLRAAGRSAHRGADVVAEARIDAGVDRDVLEGVAVARDRVARRDLPVLVPVVEDLVAARRR